MSGREVQPHEGRVDTTAWMEGIEPQVPTITRRKRVLESFMRLVPQRFAWRIRHLSAHHRWPRMNPPRTFNEKVIWRITEDRRPIIGIACDKLASKELVAEISPEILIPRVFWSGSDLSELEGVELPDRWVLKPNNGYGLVRFGEGPVSRAHIQRLLGETKGWLERPFDGPSGHRVEWGYTQAERCFLIEEFVSDGDLPPTDYKFRVFAGSVQQVSVVQDFFADPTITAMTPDWEPAGVEKGLYPSSGSPPERPHDFDSMVRCASAVGALFDFIRVDFYSSRRGAIFGELTAYPSAGLMPTHPRSLDFELGSHWVLPSLESRS